MKILSIVFVLIVNFCFGQNQNNKWYFGLSAGIDFSGGTLTTLNNSAMLQDEGTAVICDSLGNLLFYTNGVSIWNSNNVQMQQGFGLLGNNSSSQSALIIPKPLNCDRYYLFTVPAQDTITPLCYSTIDMSYNLGLGKVVSKNNSLHTPVSERLNATLKSNGVDYWVVAQDADSASFLVYSITSNGVNPNPQIFPSSNPIAPGTLNYNLIGEMKISKDGTKIGYSQYNQYLCVVCDFDNLNGHISNCFSLTQNYRPYGLEFSPDASKLYVSNIDPPYTLLQYDLLAGVPSAIQNSSQVIYTTTFPPFQYGGSLQLGPDDKIYAARHTTHFISVINQPNQSGLACDYVDSVIYLNNGTCELGLPNCIKQYSSCNGGVTSLSEFEDSNIISVYPNPFSDFTTITFPNKQSKSYSLVVYNINGQIVLKNDDIHSSEVRIYKDDLKRGIYFFQLVSENEIYSGKLIVE